jgi:hypothetical protein
MSKLTVDVKVVHLHTIPSFEEPRVWKNLCGEPFVAGETIALRYYTLLSRERGMPWCEHCTRSDVFGLFVLTQLDQR